MAQFDRAETMSEDGGGEVVGGRPECHKKETNGRSGGRGGAHEFLVSQDLFGTALTQDFAGLVECRQRRPLSLPK